MEYSLPFGTKIVVNGDGPEITSTLEAEVGSQSATALHTFLLALTGAGIDMSDKRIAIALQSTVEILSGRI